MADSLQLLRGTSQQVAAYQGAEGEVLLDLDRMVLGLVDSLGVIHSSQHGDAILDAMIALTGLGLIERTGDGALAIVPITAAGKALLDDADAAAQRATLGLSGGGSGSYSANTGAAYTIDLANGNFQILTLTAALVTLTFPEVTTGTLLYVVLRQDDVGSRIVSWSSSMTWKDGAIPGLSMTGNRGEIFLFAGLETKWAGMVIGQNIGGIVTDVDPYFSSVPLLLHFNGAHGSSTFLDSSSYHRAITAVGDVQLTTQDKKFGASSGNFDGAGDYVSFTGDASLQICAGDFTFEGWAINLAADWSEKRTIYSFSFPPYGLTFYYQTSKWYAGVGGSTPINGVTITVAVGVWFAWAVTRSGNTVRVFINGVLVATGTTTQSMTSSPTTCNVGASMAGTEYWKGRIDEVRITKGTARYTSDYAPSTIQFPDQ